MPRRPVTVEAQQGGSPRQRLWAAIRKACHFGTDEILARANVLPRTGKPYLEALKAGGWLVIDENRRWILVRDSGAEPPRVGPDGRPVTQGLGREQLWRTIRMLRTDFDYRDLAIAASTDDVAVSEADARYYVKHLALAGLLLCVQPDNRKHPARYRLARNTGPLAPKITRARVVWDPNTGKLALAEELEP
jgi:hypothetical protein